MKNVIKFINLFMLVVLVTTVSCSNDDDDDNVQINLEDLEITIDENPLNGQILGLIESNSNSTMTFSIESQTPAGALSINENTGELTVADTTLFDYETNTTITATVSATDANNSAVVVINLENVNEIGDYNYGGIIFWIDPINNSTGLVCAIEDQTSSTRWDNPSGPVEPAPGTSNNLGAGSANTDTIIAHEGAVETTYAAGIARAYNGGGFNDWFLPSVDEVAEMNSNKTVINSIATNNGGTVLPDQLWTSSKIDNTGESVYLYVLTLDSPNGVLPINFRSVRAIRTWTDF